LIRFADEKSNDNVDYGLIDIFNSFISNMELIELHRVGQKFTWTNKQVEPIKAVLDRVLMSAGWDSLYPLAFVQTLFRAGSDHNPLLVILSPRDPSRPKNFKLEPAWFLEPGFKDSVIEHWPVRRGGGVLDYWQRQQQKLRQFMKGWGANLRGQYRRDRKSPTGAMQKLDSKEGLVGLSEIEWRE
jgi:hypothetical protein